MIKLVCTACGLEVELPDDIKSFYCSRCGTEWIVNMIGGIVTLKAVEEKPYKIESQVKDTVKSSKIIALQGIEDEIGNLKYKARHVELDLY